MSTLTVTGQVPDSERKAARERRSETRYQLELEFDLFRIRGAKQLTWMASGRTANWSRKSLLVCTGQHLAPGTSVQLVVRWSPGVQLVVIGRVTAAGSRGIVVRMLRRRFRGKPELAPATYSPNPEPVEAPAVMTAAQGASADPLVRNSYFLI